MSLQMVVVSERTLTKLAHERLGAQMNQNVILDVTHLIREVVTCIADELVLVHIGSGHGGTGSAMFDQTRDPRVGHDNTAVLAKVRIQFERGRRGEKGLHFEWQVVEKREH